MPDVSIIDGGSVVLLQPNTDAARDWVQENIGEDNGYQPHWPTALVERQFLPDIMEGMREAGLELDFF